jgi:hypothetical protein
LSARSDQRLYEFIKLLQFMREKCFKHSAMKGCDIEQWF